MGGIGGLVRGVGKGGGSVWTGHHVLDRGMYDDREKQYNLSLGSMVSCHLLGRYCNIGVSE